MLKIFRIDNDAIHSLVNTQRNFVNIQIIFLLTLLASGIFNVQGVVKFFKKDLKFPFLFARSCLAILKAFFTTISKYACNVYRGKYFPDSPVKIKNIMINVQLDLGTIFS